MYPAYGLLQRLPTQFAGIKAVGAHGIYLMGCRTFNQFCCTLRSLEFPARFCPFCKTERERRGRFEDEYSDDWMLLKNEFPHKDTQQMWLVVPYRHIMSMSELRVSDWRNIGELVQRCLQKYRIEGGGLVWRFGDPHYNVGTVEHLHINIIEPTPGKEYRPPFAKDEDEHAEDYRRMLGFREELVHRGGTDWLFSDKGIEETQPRVA